MFSNKHIVLCIVLFFSVSIKAQESVVKIPKKAALYSTIIPGAGQVYTKKYWKVPLIYAGLITSAYYINESHTFYDTYKQVYINRLDDDRTDEFIGIYTDANLVTLTEHYRRNTEISALLFALTYVLNIVDASVNAHLFRYNVNEDISMIVKPVYFSKENINGLSLSIKL